MKSVVGELGGTPKAGPEIGWLVIGFSKEEATISGTTFSVHCKFVSWHARGEGGSNNRELNKGDPPVSSNPHCNPQSLNL